MIDGYVIHVSFIVRISENTRCPYMKATVAPANVNPARALPGHLLLLQLKSYHLFLIMSTQAVLQRLSSDVPRTLHHINDLALDEDSEIFLHLGG